MGRASRCHFCGEPVVKTGSAQARMIDILRDEAEGWVTALELSALAGCSYEQARRLLSRITYRVERRRGVGTNGSYEYRWPDEGDK